MAADLPPDADDGRVVRVRLLRPEDVPRVQQIFGDGMRSLSPGVVRAGLLRGKRSCQAWAATLVVGALSAAYTARSSPDDASTPLAFAAARSGLIAALMFLTVYAVYLSTIMDTYVKESLAGDMRDPFAFYNCAEAAAAAAASVSADGGGGGGSKKKSGSNTSSQKNHSCFWVAELVDDPNPRPRKGAGAGASSSAAAAAAEEEQANEEEEQPPSGGGGGGLRRRLLRPVLDLADLLAENERRVQEEKIAEARAMLEPRGPPSAIVGCVGLQHRPGEERAELRRMSVDESARGRGVAVALGEALEAHARARGLALVYCTTSSLQEPARQLYGRRLGWREVDAGFHDPRAEATGVSFHRYEKALR